MQMVVIYYLQSHELCDGDVATDLFRVAARDYCRKSDGPDGSGRLHQAGHSVAIEPELDLIVGQRDDDAKRDGKAI